jgi:uncharacterized protein YkwD
MYVPYSKLEGVSMAARRVTVVLAATVLAVMAAIAVSAMRPEEAGAVPSNTVRTCDGTTMDLRPKEEALLHLHNQIRRSYGLQPFCVDPTLTVAARGHSAAMIQGNYFGHGLVGARLTSYGYNWSTYGENIAGGYGYYRSSPNSIFGMWMASPGHHSNIVNGSFQQIGMGTAAGEYNGITGYTMFTVDFATPG